MAEVVLMPQLGESVTEGTIGQWLKKVGDPVEKYESLLEVLTDKVNAEVPAPVGGTVSKILVEEGQTVAVGTPICEIMVEGEEAGDHSATANTQPAASPSQEDSTPKKAVLSAAATVENTEGASESLRGRYSPAVRRLAMENHINPDTITGSGAKGRVTRQDILNAVAKQAEAPKVTPSEHEEPMAKKPASPPPAPAPGTVSVVNGAPAVIDPEDEIVPLSSIRKVIAERMVRSKTTVPHAWLMMEVDVSGLVALREQLKEEFKAKEGVSLTYMPFMLRAVVQALKAVPEMNAQWNGDSIVMKKRINIGMATATDRGLVVPVIKDADQKNIVGLAKASQDLVKRARAGRLTMDDLTGGTFTVDNTGAIGTVLTYPIINAPEVGIITMESIVKRPVVIQDMVAIRPMMNICISFDHRVVDGAEAGKFVRLVKENLEAIGPSTSIY
ncbi:MAG: branched-chain alpha-keto acid dehydrogenase subunit E2 [Sulfobacillus thermosulfidooxidans]|uniref:Dihydrolipoamide acetyltransferase component of pyruvate dehydrogenase complex n=1 Tax=Sulfobacillus thermosulfidooxidans TaxID=28034 RepID=A0A2T2WWR4_SULTH|nr:MAG: branched-chain alpha-keto acid dehydrogenase subunit E2 [Sulfobacillus thermosulfidooxidans]